MWFEQLTGFREQSPSQVRANLRLDGDKLQSLVNQRVMTCGTLEIPSLGDLRQRVASLDLPADRLRLSELVGDVRRLHRDVKNANAMFQVASQFNLLEMVSPFETPEDGVDKYEGDPTQGPACAVACGAGTIYRNYFAKVEGEQGQSATRQIDCLADVGESLGNVENRLWKMQNGYALPQEGGLQSISQQLRSMDAPALDALRSRLRVGVQWQSEVTLGEADHRVSQVYCSALPVAYTTFADEIWLDFAQLVLDAAYEATFRSAILNQQATGCNRLFLTLLGGGAFGNRDEWIVAAIRRSVKLFREANLDVFIVSFSRSRPEVRELME